MSKGSISISKVVLSNGSRFLQNDTCGVVIGPRPDDLTYRKGLTVVQITEDKESHAEDVLTQITEKKSAPLSPFATTLCQHAQMLRDDLMNYFNAYAHNPPEGVCSKCFSAAVRSLATAPGDVVMCYRFWFHDLMVQEECVDGPCVCPVVLKHGSKKERS